jgi:PAS domain S-box-containing protein
MLYLPASPIRAPARLAALEQTGLLDEPPGEQFDRLTRFAAAILRVPMATITMIEADQQVVVSHAGIPDWWANHRTTPIDRTFCQHVVRSGEALIVEDARKHPLVRDSPLIGDAGVIAYAGLPWRTPDGLVQGALCAMDHLPRVWTGEEIRLLRELSDIVTDTVRDRVLLRRAQGSARPQEPLLTNALLRQRLAGICVIQDSRITYANERFLDIFGYSENALLTLEDPLSLFAESERDRVAESLRRRMEGHSGADRQLLVGRRMDGAAVWIEAHAARVTLGGRPALMALVVDVSEWKRAEEVGSMRRDSLDVAIRAIADAAWDWETSTGRLQWVGRPAQVLRHGQAELGDSIDWWTDRIHDDDRERVTARLQALFDGPANFWSDEYRFRRGDGTYAILLSRGTLMRDGRGTPLHLIAATMDVTEPRRAEDTQRFLANASALLADAEVPELAILELVKLIVPALADFCLFQVLESGAGGSGHRGLAQVVPSDHGSLHGPHESRGDDDAIHPLLREAIRRHEAMLLPIMNEEACDRLRLSNQERSWVRDLAVSTLLVTPLGFRGEVIGAIALGMSESRRTLDPMDLHVSGDLAQRIGMALGAARLYAEARDAVHGRDEVLNMVSHDLRNPLSSILMAATLLDAPPAENPADGHRWLATIRKSAGQMNAIIDDLLDYARIEQGRFSVDLTAQRVGDLLEEARQAHAPLADRKGVQLECAAENDSDFILVDAWQIQRVFSNVIGNAIKFTPDGGKVSVRAERADSMTHFSVRDSGPGILADHLPHLFDRYWQAARADRRGLGLGLAIARGIVEAHGGQIWAESTPGEGAIFRFTFPCQDRPEPAVAGSG